MFRWPRLRKESIATPVIVNVVDDDYIDNFVIEWSLKYPVDRWWRRKHKVAFNSPVHRDTSFFDMRFEFEEEMMLRKTRREHSYIPNTGNWIDVDVLTSEDEGLSDKEKIEKYKREFEHIDLDQYSVD